MREDFAKLLVERPRLGAGRLRKVRALRDGQPWPKAIGLRRAVAERGSGKNLNENLSPLRRYLAKQIGRPWRKVYSEIRARIRVGDTVSEHILAHLYDLIHLHVVIVRPDKLSPCGLQRAPGLGHRSSWGLAPGDLYVDPSSGLVRAARRKLKGPI